MKISIILTIIFFASLARAAMHQMAMIQNGLVINVAAWNDVSPWNPPGYTIVDVSSQPQVGIGWTCSRCDGSDFVAPQN